MSEHFDAQTRSNNGVLIIDLKGEINNLSEETLNRAYQQAISQNARTVLLNFRQVDYINSKGIALIVGLLAEARKSGRTLLTTGLSEHYVEIFKITRLSDFMKMVPDESAAG